MYTYNLSVELVNRSAPILTMPQIKNIVLKAEKDVNDYYRHSAISRVPNPKSLGIKINANQLDIRIDCPQKLSIGREGNALRQFSCTLIKLGLDKNISNSVPGKLLRRA